MLEAAVFNHSKRECLFVSVCSPFNSRKTKLSNAEWIGHSVSPQSGSLILSSEGELFTQSLHRAVHSLLTELFTQSLLRAFTQSLHRAVHSVSPQSCSLSLSSELFTQSLHRAVHSVSPQSCSLSLSSERFTLSSQSCSLSLSTERSTQSLHRVVSALTVGLLQTLLSPSRSLFQGQSGCAQIADVDIISVIFFILTHHLKGGGVEPRIQSVSACARRAAGRDLR